MESKIEYDLNFDDYLAADGISQSQLKNLAKCAKYYKYMLENNLETEALKFGNAVHSYILGQHEFDKKYFITPKITKRGKAWDDVLMQAADKEVIFEEELKKIKDMNEVLLADNYCSQLLDDAICESSIFWTDKSTGINCRCRIDGFKKINNQVVLFDLKTTKSCSEDEFKRQFFSLKYHIQAAYYLDGFEAIMQAGYLDKVERPIYFVIMAIEKDAPYLYSIHVIHRDSEVIKTGRKEYQYLLRLYNECNKENNFNQGISERPFMIERMPLWYIPKI